MASPGILAMRATTETIIPPAGYAKRLTARLYASGPYLALKSVLTRKNRYSQVKPKTSTLTTLATSQNGGRWSVALNREVARKYRSTGTANRRTGPSGVLSSGICFRSWSKPLRLTGTRRCLAVGRLRIPHAQAPDDQRDRNEKRGRGRVQHELNHSFLQGGSMRGARRQRHGRVAGSPGGRQHVGNQRCEAGVQVRPERDP